MNEKKGVIIPARSKKNKKVEEHAFFSMEAKDKTPVEKIMQKLRRGRFKLLVVVGGGMPAILK